MGAHSRRGARACVWVPDPPRLWEGLRGGLRKKLGVRLRGPGGEGVVSTRGDARRETRGYGLYKMTGWLGAPLPSPL